MFLIFYLPRRVKFFALDLSYFNGHDWPLHDMSIRGVLWRRFKRRNPLCTEAKHLVASKLASQTLWPLVFLLIYSLNDQTNKTPSMFISKQARDQLCLSSMDNDWDCKIMIRAYGIKCLVSWESLVFSISHWKIYSTLCNICLQSYEDASQFKLGSNWLVEAIQCGGWIL